MGWLLGNLGGALGKRWVMAVIATIFLGLISTIGIFQMQKDGLREDITEISAQMSKAQAEHISEILRITVKNNQMIKSKIAEEEIKRLNAEISRQKVKARVELIINRQLNKKLKKLESMDLGKCKLSEELKTLLNGDK
jgi:capsular polysaccharide biosynthesis protein